MWFVSTWEKLLTRVYNVIGFINSGRIPYSDDSLPDKSVRYLDSQALVFKIRLPKGSKPLVG